MVNKELLSPCGLYCGVCGIYHATKNKDDKLREKLGQFYGMPAEKLNCSGCLSDNVFEYCKVCAIKSCAKEKGIEGCNECNDFPCEIIDKFPIPIGKENILRAVPRWKELGTEKWVMEEEKLVSCKSCGTVAFRGARKCKECKEPL